MAGSPSRVDVSAQPDSNVEDDFFNSLLNLTPYNERFPELNLTPQPPLEVPQEQQEAPQEHQEVPPANQEEPQEQQEAPPVQAQATGSSRVSNRRIASREPLTMERFSSLFHLTEKEAAKEAGWGLGNFRKQRRALGIEKWPYRKVKSVNFVVNKLQELNETSKRINKGMLNNTIPMMENLRQELQVNPNVTLGPEAVQARIVAHRSLYRRRKKDKKIMEQHQS